MRELPRHYGVMNLSWIQAKKTASVARPQILQKIEKNLGHREAVGETTKTVHTAPIRE